MDLPAVKQLDQQECGIRSIGLFSVLELVRDRATKEPLQPEKMAAIGKSLRENGLFTYINGSMLFVVPPLCINQTQLDEGLDIVERAILSVA